MPPGLSSQLQERNEPPAVGYQQQRGNRSSDPGHHVGRSELTAGSFREKNNNASIWAPLAASITRAGVGSLNQGAAPAIPPKPPVKKVPSLLNRLALTNKIVSQCPKTEVSSEAAAAEKLNATDISPDPNLESSAGNQSSSSGPLPVVAPRVVTVQPRRPRPSDDRYTEVVVPRKIDRSETIHASPQRSNGVTNGPIAAEKLLQEEGQHRVSSRPPSAERRRADVPDVWHDAEVIDVPKGTTARRSPADDPWLRCGSEVSALPPAGNTSTRPPVSSRPTGGPVLVQPKRTTRLTDDYYPGLTQKLSPDEVLETSAEWGTCSTKSGSLNSTAERRVSSRPPSAERRRGSQPSSGGQRHHEAEEMVVWRQGGPPTVQLQGWATALDVVAVGRECDSVLPGNQLPADSRQVAGL